MSTRMTRGSAPGTGISREHSSGTRLSPMRRAATAGNSASRSGVSVKMQLTIESPSRRLRSSSSCMSSSVAWRIGSDSLASTVVAPRRAIKRICGTLAAGAPQFLDLRRREPPVLALLELPQPQWPEAHALERDHRMPDRLEHSPHLALAPLVDGDLDPVGAEPLHAS